MTLMLAQGRGRVLVEVYDALGRLVAVLADGPMGAGERGLAFDGSGLPVGVYVVRVRTSDGYVDARRVTLVR